MTLNCHKLCRRSVYLWRWKGAGEGKKRASRETEQVWGKGCGELQKPHETLIIDN